MRSMSDLFENKEYSFSYRGVSVCVLGDIENWQEVAKENNLIAETSAEIVAWFTYHNKPLDIFKGNYLVLYK